MRYVCACGQLLKVESNHGRWISKLDTGEKYQVYAGDVWACPNCNIEIMVTAHKPRSGHWQPDFDEEVHHARSMPYCWEE